MASGSAVERNLFSSLAYGPTDDELVALAKEGSHEAYVELCRRYSKMLSRVVNQITMNREDTEDALQDSFLKGYLHLGNFEGRSKFSTWITRIAINTALMSIRKRTCHPMQSLHDLTDCELNRCRGLSRQSPDPENQAAQRQISLKFKEAVRTLPPKLRDIIELRLIDDLSLGEVAVLAGASVAATKSRLLRARLELSKRLSGAR